jgi:hypothetical protein
VFLTDGEFKKKTKNLIAPFIRSEVFTAIEDLQPYKTSDPPETSLLWQLSQLDIIDKHRLLVVVSQKFKVTGFEATLPNGQTISGPISHYDWKASKEGAEIFTIDFSQAFAGPGKVNMKVETATTIQFANTGLCCDVGIAEATIAACGELVKKIIDGFGKRFFGE